MKLVRPGGAREELLEITIDPLAMESYGLSPGDVLNFVERNNRLVAAGALLGATLHGPLVDAGLRPERAFGEESQCLAGFGCLDDGAGIAGAASVTGSADSPVSGAGSGTSRPQPAHTIDRRIAVIVIRMGSLRNDVV